MKKLLKLLLTMMLTFSMMFMLVACGSEDSDDDSDKKDKKSEETTVEVTEPEEVTIVGTWQGAYDMTSLLNEYMGTADEEIASYFNFSDFSMVLKFTFNEDGTMSIVADETAMEASIESLKEDFKTGMTAYLEDMLAAEGVEMTLDDYLTEAGMTMDELVDTALGDTFTAEALVGDFNTEGEYREESGKLYIISSDDDSSEEYFEYTLSATELVLESFVGEEEAPEGMLPLTLTKIN